MKKKLIAAALLVIGIAILSAGTIAYFTSATTAHNVITSGGVDIVLKEWADRECKTPYPADEPMLVMPGKTVTKVVTVKNEDADAYVRAKFVITVLNPDGEKIDSDAVIIETGSFWTENYEERDGWYYYFDPLKTGEVSKPLFSQVVFDGPSMTNEYQNCTVTVDVIAQAVQAANNGKTWREAKGWPTEPTEP